MKAPGQDPEQRLPVDQEEEKRRQVELAILEDDDFFDEMRAAEAEMLHSYVQGELDDSTSLRLAELVGRSRRLQESAETTLALHLRQAESSGLRSDPENRVDRHPGDKPTTPQLNLANQWLTAALLILVLIALWQTHTLRQDLLSLKNEQLQLLQKHQSLETDVQLQKQEIERLRQENLGWQRRWAEQASPDPRRGH